MELPKTKEFSKFPSWLFLNIRDFWVWQSLKLEMVAVLKTNNSANTSTEDNSKTSQESALTFYLTKANAKLFHMMLRTILGPDYRHPKAVGFTLFKDWQTFCRLVIKISVNKKFWEDSWFLTNNLKIRSLEIETKALELIRSTQLSKRRCKNLSLPSKTKKLISQILKNWPSLSIFMDWTSITWEPSSKKPVCRGWKEFSRQKSQPVASRTSIEWIFKTASSILKTKTPRKGRSKDRETEWYRSSMSSSATLSPPSDCGETSTLLPSTNIAPRSGITSSLMSILVIFYRQFRHISR